jgi:DNA modification methylase
MAETAATDGLDIIYRPVEMLIPYARNARTHSEKQVGQIAASIQEFGFTNPVLVRKDGDGHINISAGHARCLAAARLGLTEVPTLDLNYLSAEQARAYVIADNRLAETAGWDLEMLDLEFTSLVDAGYELDLTGFDETARNGIMRQLERDREANRRDDEDDAPEKLVETDIQPGDVIQLGDHKLICGDATDKAVVFELLGKEKPGLMVTDPPYGVSLDANWRAKTNTQPLRDIIPNDDRDDWREAYEHFRGDVAYVWHGGLSGHVVAEGLLAAGFKVRSQIIWRKNRFAMSRGDYHWMHEPCYYAVREGEAGQFLGGRKQTTVWEIDIIQRFEHKHPNQKPVECMRRPMLNNSNPGQLVYDPFGGTGTTLVAAELTGRIARLIELDPAFCQLIVERYKTLFVDRAEGEGDAT